MIRKARLEDVPACLFLLGRYSTGGIEDWGQTFVAEQGGQVVGFAVCRVWDEVGAKGYKRRIGKLEPFVVAPDKPLACLRLYERCLHFFEDTFCEAVEGLIGADNRKLLEAAKKYGFYEATVKGTVVRKELL